MMGTNRSQYALNIDLNVLNHLGLNLYSNVPAVLSELVANAWDADASKVSIEVEECGQGEKRIRIQDDGCGMNSNELQNKYLTVGYQRRSDTQSDKTPKGRLVMGRKGIGKLCVFSIASRVQIFTLKKDNEPIALQLDLEELQEAINAGSTYNPVIISVPEGVELRTSGTVLVLKKLKKRVYLSMDEHLRRRLARRFFIISNEFQVVVDGTPIGPDDRDYFKNLEYALVYGKYDKSNFHHDEEHVVERGNHVEVDGEASGQHDVTGWIGLVGESGKLQISSDNLNKISILVRGKVALEDILSSYREGGLYTKYVIGELSADFLDITEKEDIATSNRQDIMQNDPRFTSLREFIRKELGFLSSERVKIKKEGGLRKAQKYPEIERWYEGLGPDFRVIAGELFGTINQIEMEESHRKEIYVHAVLAFEHLQYKEKLNQLDQLNAENMEVFVKIFSELDEMEASWYYKITKGRLDIINKLAELVEENAKERVIQELIYEHLWLLDPSWDRATETPEMEKTVKNMFDKLSKELSDEEKRGRIDIQYKKTSGKHVIIELKRSSVKLSDGQLMDQADKYRRALRKQLKFAGEQEVVEVVCIVGTSKALEEDPPERERSKRAMNEKGIRVVTYDQLINDAQKSYQNYYERSRKQYRRIEDVMKMIEKGGT